MNRKDTSPEYILQAHQKAIFHKTKKILLGQYIIDHGVLPP